MKYQTLLGLCLFASSAIAQTVTPTVTGQSVTLQFPANDGGTYTVTLPYSVSASIGETTFTGGILSTPLSDAASFSPATVSYAAPVAPPPPPSGPAIPANATKVILDPMTFKQTKDAGTPGTACTSSLPCSNPYPVAIDAAHPSAKQFNMAYSARAGVRWSVNIANDPNAENFVYDTWIYIPDVSQVANLEMDTNQVTAAGNTRILGFQCSHYDHAWDYTLSKLSTGGSWHWVASKVACDPTLWTAKTWHHIQIVGHFDSNDVSYYDGVWFDGAYSAIGGSGATGYALGWSKGSVVINFQIDGLATGNGSTSVSASQLTIYRW